MDEIDGEWILPEPWAWPLDESSAYVACGVLRAHGIAAFVWHPFAGGLPHCSPVPGYVLAVEAGAGAEVAEVLNAPVPEDPPEDWMADPTAEIDQMRIGTPDLGTMVLTALVYFFVPFVAILFCVLFDNNGPPPKEALPPRDVAVAMAGVVLGGVLAWALMLPLGAAMRGHRVARILLRSLIGIYLAANILVPLALVLYLRWTYP